MMHFNNLNIHLCPIPLALADKRADGVCQQSSVFVLVMLLTLNSFWILQLVPTLLMPKAFIYRVYANRTQAKKNNYDFKLILARISGKGCHALH